MIAATQSDGFVRSGKMESPPPVRGRVGAFRGSPDIRMWDWCACSCFCSEEPA